MKANDVRHGLNRTVGTWACVAFAAVVVIYMVLLGEMMVAELPFPPTGARATAFHVVLLLSAVVAVPMWCSIHLAAAERLQVFTLPALAFLVMHALLVAVNRFVGLTLANRSSEFVPYGMSSLTFTLEMLGFGLFFGLACLALVPAFGHRPAIALAFAVSGGLSLVGGVGFALGSVEVLGMVAPVGWGVAPVAAAVLVAVHLGAAAPRRAAAQ